MAWPLTLVLQEDNVDHDSQHIQWMKNLHGNPHGKYGNVGWDYREFLEMALEGRPGIMCGGP